MNPPTIERELERFLAAIAKKRDSGDYQAALEACTTLVANPETQAAGLRARADVYVEMGDRAAEAADREALVALTDEPGDYFDLGIALWKNGRTTDAANAFERAIELGEAADFHYYTNASRMHLAALLVRLNRHAEAQKQCMPIPADYSSYLPGDGVTTREQLLQRAKGR